MTAPVIPDPAEAKRATRRRWGRRLEFVLWIGVLGFALVRLGPQIGVWTGLSLGIQSDTPRTPVWEARTLAGGEVGSEPFAGNVQVLTFWATWCRVCAIELPGLERLHARWGDEIRVLGLSIDDAAGAEGGAPLVRDHAAQKGYTFPIAMADRPLRMAFGGIPGVPTTFIVDRDGVVRHTLIGVTAPGTLERAVRRLMEETPDLH